MEPRSIQNMKVQVLSITQACTFEHQRQDVYSMETKLDYLLDSGNILNMFQIQNIKVKYLKKMGVYILKYSASNWAYSALQYREIFVFRLGFRLEISYLFRFADFKVCIFVFVNKTKFVQVLRIYTYLSKSYKPFFYR